MKTLRRIALLTILAVAALLCPSAQAISYFPPPVVDPNQAQMVDLMAHVNQLNSMVQSYLAYFPGNAYFLGESDANSACWSLINNEIGYPTQGNLWDIGAAVAVGYQNATFEASTGSVYWQGVAAELGSVLYWVNWEIGQPGVVR